MVDIGIENKKEFRLSWLSVIPDIILIAFFVGIFTLPIKVLRIITTKLIVDPNMVYGEIGILKKEIQNSPIKHIQSVRVNRSLFGRILGYGNVIITTAGHGYNYKFMANPERIRELINSYMV